MHILCRYFVEVMFVFNFGGFWPYFVRIFSISVRGEFWTSQFGQTPAAYTLVRVESVDVNHPMLYRTRKPSLEVTPTNFRTVVMHLCDDDEIAVTYLQFQTQVYFYGILVSPRSRNGKTSS